MADRDRRVGRRGAVQQDLQPLARGWVCLPEPVDPDLQVGTLGTLL